MATYDLTSSIPTKIATGDILNCPYSGTYKTITLPKGIYQFECWGAQGGGTATEGGGGGNPKYGGKGGYSIGIVNFNSDKVIYIYSGGQGSADNRSNAGTTVTTSGGFNGGGSTITQGAAGSGGGASDIRIGSNSLYARIIVAGGGGGAGWNSNGFAGGGLYGICYLGATTSASSAYSGAGGPTSGGAKATTGQGSYGTLTDGTFGQGGTGIGNSSGSGGGGGGWYGGGGSGYSGGSGGGSGYVYTVSTASNYPSGCLLDSSMYLTDASTIAGNASMPSTSGSTETGHSGNGYVRITVISVRASGEWVEKESYIFPYTGSVQTRTFPKGVYKIECWGAQGGYRSSSTYGGKGGYSVGKLTLSGDTQLYIYVGGSGNTGGTSGGFNGGGIRHSYNGGGGASDVRIGQDSLYARVIVAGGGGSDGATSYGGSYGGGIQGGAAGSGCGTVPSGYGTQNGVSGGSSYLASSRYTTANPTTQASTYAGFGFGGAGPYHSSGYGGAGGGGWYGGGGCYPDGSADDDKGGCGGSGYVYTESTASSYPSGCLLNSSYYLTEAETKKGNVSFPSTSGGTETGHEGNGYIKITRFVYKSALPFKMKVNNEIIEPTAGFVKVNGEWKSLTGTYAKNNGEWLGT